MTTNLLEKVCSSPPIDSNFDRKDARTQSIDACEGDSTDHDSSDQQADLRPDTLNQGATIGSSCSDPISMYIGIVNTLYKTAV